MSLGAFVVIAIDSGPVDCERLEIRCPSREVVVTLAGVKTGMIVPYVPVIPTHNER
jgi:hypothetical protein